MKAQWLQAWRARAPRERLFLAAGALVVVSALFYALLVDPLLQSAKKADRQLPELRRQEAAMVSLAERARSLQSSPKPAVASPDATGLSRQAVQAGLAVRVAANGEGAFNVQFDKVAVTGLLDWLATLQTRSRLFVREAQLDAAGAGLVSGRLVLGP